MRVRGIDQDMQPEHDRRRREYIVIAFVAILMVAVAVFEIYTRNLIPYPVKG